MRRNPTQGVATPSRPRHRQGRSFQPTGARTQRHRRRRRGGGRADADLWRPSERWPFDKSRPAALDPEYRPDRGRHRAQHHRPHLYGLLGFPRGSRRGARSSVLMPLNRFCRRRFAAAPSSQFRPRPVSKPPSVGVPPWSKRRTVPRKHWSGCCRVRTILRHVLRHEAGQFQQAGLSAIVCGPGSIQQAHQPDGDHPEIPARRRRRASSAG